MKGSEMVKEGAEVLGPSEEGGNLKATSTREKTLEYAHDTKL